MWHRHEVSAVFAAEHSGIVITAVWIRRVGVIAVLADLSDQVP